MSGRGSSPKMASESSIEPDSLPSSDMIVSCMSGALLLGRRATFGGCRLGCPAAVGSRFRQAELAGLGRILRQFLLDRVAQRAPAALCAGNRALDHDAPWPAVG